MDSGNELLYSAISFKGGKSNKNLVEDAYAMVKSCMMQVEDMCMLIEKPLL